MSMTFSTRNATFCCGLLEVGSFGLPYRWQDWTEEDINKVAKQLQSELIDACEIREESYYDDEDEDGHLHAGCISLYCTIPVENTPGYNMMHKLLLKAGMVEVKRWTNVNSGNELAMLVSPNEWPSL